MRVSAWRAAVMLSMAAGDRSPVVRRLTGFVADGLKQTLAGG